MLVLLAVGALPQRGWAGLIVVVRVADPIALVTTNVTVYEPPVVIVGANVAVDEVAVLLDIDHAYAHPVWEPPEVTLNEHGEPALAHPVVTTVGSGALRASVIDALAA